MQLIFFFFLSSVVFTIQFPFEDDEDEKKICSNRASNESLDDEIIEHLFLGQIETRTQLNAISYGNLLFFIIIIVRLVQ